MARYEEGDEIESGELPRLYHGTYAKLNPGDEIEAGFAPANDGMGGRSHRGGYREHTYATPDKSLAEQYAYDASTAARKRGANIPPGYFGHIYEVQPTGSTEIDPEYHPHGVEDMHEAIAVRSEFPFRVLNSVQF